MRRWLHRQPDGRRLSSVERTLLVCAVVGALAAVLALKPFDGLWGSDANGHAGSQPVVPTPSGGRLELAQWVVRNGPAVFRPPGEPNAVQTRASLPTIDLTLLNHTSSRVLLIDARIEIEAYAEFPICFTQGGGPVPASPPYTIRLPSSPRPSEPPLVQPLHEQLGPDDADRIELLFAPPHDRVEVSDFMYAVHLTLRTSDARQPTIDAGRYVLAVPGSIGWDSERLPVTPPTLALTHGGLGLVDTWCYRRNLAQLHALLTRPARRSPQLRAMAQIAGEPRWLRDADRRSPRAAAWALLNAGEDLRIPALAAFAAEQTGDDAYAGGIRAGVAQSLLEQARGEAAAGYWTDALGDARESLALAYTPQAARFAAEAASQQAR